MTDNNALVAAEAAYIKVYVDQVILYLRGNRTTPEQRAALRAALDQADKP